MDATTTDVRRARLDIEGMNCGHCVDAVRAALSAVAGLKVVKVAVGSAEVEGAGGPVLASAVAAIADAGFAAKAVDLGPSIARTADQKGCGGGGCGCGRRA
jgi:copper chaperone